MTPDRCPCWVPWKHEDPRCPQYRPEPKPEPAPDLHAEIEAFLAGECE